MNKILLVSFLIISFLFSNGWFYSENNPWDINNDSRSSALGGIDLYNYTEFNSDSTSSDIVRIFNSSMFNNIIDYNNISYKQRINDITIIGNTFNKIKVGLLNRVIDNIENTSLVWNSEFANDPTLSDLNYELIEYYEHRDVGLSVFVPFSNFMGEFGLDIRSIFSKIDTYSANSINFDFIYFKKIADNISIMTSINNFYSYKKWDNQTLEKFYPELEILTHLRLKNTNYFLEVNGIYLEDKFLNNHYNIVDNVKIGIEQSINNKLKLRLGYSKNYQTYGFGLVINSFILDYSHLKHANLDFSNQFTIAYLIGH